MRKVVLLLVAMLVALPMISCKEENPKNDLTTETAEILSLENNDLALAEVDIEDSISEDRYRYITAYSGLSLREYANLQSNRLAKMPYGSRVKLIQPEAERTMTVSGIAGGMDMVEFDHRSGYAFNGYLSRYFPPEQDISVEGYANELSKVFPEVTFTKTNGGTVSKPTLTETISLPGAHWHEAFFIGQRLYEFPKEFEFPLPAGKDFQLIKDSKPKRDLWVSQLEITRQDDQLQKIEYIYSSAKYSNRVSIIEKEGAILITRTEVTK
ncbi:hypothetical protein [Aureitalea marina]|uniref:SH3b domain-containing protein n=1 Tax=Aureitalea marina TaxID=930804 RepID=A0A2S7KRW2_9FLAO|nr:hypothetical protein [Aureitalea marina]PQB05350.1 hypothetical protein BST85_10980 [Aureitalea marina]